MSQNRIDSFRDAYRFLSNFFPAEVSYEGAIYPSVENAFQAAKCVDVSERTVFAVCSPAEAKRFGRRVRLRPDWEQVKLNIMHQLVTDKFTRSDELRRRLLATGDAELVEGNAWNDTFWGVCRGRGQNHLGRILMEVRDGLRGGSL